MHKIMVIITENLSIMHKLEQMCVKIEQVLFVKMTEANICIRQNAQKNETFVCQL